MSSEAVLAVQAISLVLVVMALAGSIHCIKMGGSDWRMLALPLLLIINLGLFYVIQIVIELMELEMPSGVKSWAILLRFQTALTAVASIGLVMVKRKFKDE